MAFPLAGRADDGGNSAAMPPSDDDVVMKQFIVRASRIDKHPWLYVEFPGYEILSHCDPSETQMVAGRIMNELAMEKQFVPAAYWASPVIPMTLILVNEETNANVVRRLLPEPGRQLDPPDFGMPADLDNFAINRPRTTGLGISRFGFWADPGFGTAYQNERGPPTDRYLVQGSMVASDSDTYCCVQNRWGMRWMVGQDQGGGLSLPDSSGLAFRLQQCAPAPPLWYIDGLAGLPCGLLRVWPMGSNHSGMMPGFFRVAAALWVSSADTNAILAAARKAKSLPVLPSIDQLFRVRRQDEADPSPIWMADAALFVRWGIFEKLGEDKKHVRAFATFLERSRVEPVTEAVFRECFGFGYAEMQSRLSRYLRVAVNDPFSVDFQDPLGKLDFASGMDWPPPHPFPVTREATTDEIGRILGDWQRMQGNMLRVRDPELSKEYLHLAGRVLERAYREDNGLPPDVDPSGKGEPSTAIPSSGAAGPAVVMKSFVVTADRIHDPRLLAVYGMYEHDTGNVAKAREFLETAVKAAVVRPAAYVDLAQIYFADALAHPTAAGRQFTAEQTEHVLKPLLAARSKSRLDVSGYRLIAEAWEQSLTKPLAANLDVLREGMRLYPLDSSLCFSAAKAYAKWGYTAEAKSLISHGLKSADAQMAKQLLSLRSSLGR